jgi:predicted Zn-dependent protease
MKTPRIARARRARAPLAASVAWLALACATNPVTGRQEVVFMSPEREAAQGKQAAAQVEREIGLVRDPALTAYVERIGERMAGLSPRKDVAYRFAVADMPEANAFALPGGYVYVSRGLLALANDEDELAGVIGHEIGHVAARHAAQRETRSMGVGLLSVLGTIAAGVVGGGEAAQMASQLGQVAGAGLIASYSRDQERQADVVGQELAAAGGWDPEALADFLVTLDREGRVRTGKARNPSFLDSHPQPGERAVAARERAPELPRGAEPRIARGRDAYLARIEGILVGPNPEEGVFEEELFVHPGLGFAIDFPPRWPTQNTKQAVGAIAPERDAMVLLELQGRSEDPKTAAQRWTQANRVQVARHGPTRIGGWPAYRALAEAQGQQGAVALDVTWIAHPKGTFRITGVASPQRYRARAASFERTATSFRAISASERELARPLRLRVATARQGETLASLGQRTGNRWSPQQTAVANGIDAGAPLRAGQRIKVALRE